MPLPGLIRFFGAKASAPVTPVDTGVVQSASAVTFNYTGITVSAGIGNSALVILFSTTGPPTSAVWDAAGANQAMTLIGGQNNTGCWAGIYALANPTPGAKTLTITQPTSRTIAGIAQTYSGVKQTSPIAGTSIGAGSSNNSPIVTRTGLSANGNLEVACLSPSSGANNILSPNQTVIVTSNSTTPKLLAQSAASAAPSISFSASLQNSGAWAYISNELIAANPTG